MMLSPAALCNLRALILGAAREGTALAGYLASAGAEVVLCDRKSAADLPEQLSALTERGVCLALGADPDKALLQWAQVLFISPGVPRNAATVVHARTLGMPISSEPRLFTQSCPAMIVGITGSSGKTTTTALTGEMLTRAGKNAWVGGNIGTPLTERLLERPWPDVAVMELSSFQLELFTPEYQGAMVKPSPIDVGGYSPQVALVTNITPNHLDRHADMAEYAAAKHNIMAHQQPGNWLVLNADDAYTRPWQSEARANLLLFSLVLAPEQGAFLLDDTLWLRYEGCETALCRADEVQLRGHHNLANLAAAACAASCAGASPQAIAEVARTFAGVPHRLEVVARMNGVIWVNDSIATSPERACAALSAYREPIVLLAGGRDKHLPWDTWAQLVRERARAVVAFGEAVPIIRDALKAAGTETPILEAADLPEAVALAHEMAEPGDVVLLSPGGTSFDAYADFEERGRHFRTLVHELEVRT
ncbi:MAG: UDP-N-acetylmuramoyl-L-alanine--D-glutamate ligase [Chloroflexi bacterium]|nr:UDP-N-acetylmuramoyl-L-alanine--D-glutamate ligase [Chloroflexota bacterium]